jgi:hypothetical protein
MRQRYAVVLLATALALAIGFLIGAWWSGTPRMATGDAYSAENQVSIEADGITYAMPLDVTWMDADDSWQHGSRPACVPPSLETIEGVRFAWVDVRIASLAWVDVRIASLAWREIVWVDCR